MVRRFCLFLVFVFIFTPFTLPAQAQTSPPARQTQNDKESDLQAMKADVQRMRVILNQMRENLAFVDTTQSPLKHQFQLEADMWQVLLDQMDRRISVLEAARPTAPNK
jgi:hypothetical protein